MTFEEWKLTFYKKYPDPETYHTYVILEEAWEAGFNEGVRTLSENLQNRLGLDDDS